MASYVEKTLGDDEDVIYNAKFNWTYSFWSFFFLILSIIPAIVLGLFHFKGGLIFEDLKIGWGFAGFSALVGFLQYLGHMIILWTTEIAITSFRFVYKKGLISRVTKEVSLNKIEEITLNQSVWGRIFNFGALTLRGTGVGVIELPNLDDPIKVRKIIENAKSSMREGPIHESHPVNTSPSSQLAPQLSSKQTSTDPKKTTDVSVLIANNKKLKAERPKPLKQQAEKSPEDLKAKPKRGFIFKAKDKRPKG